MKNLKYLLLSFLLINLLSQNISSKPIDLALVDTSQAEPYLYEPFIKISKVCNFKPHYFSIADFLDKKINLNNFQAIFFLINEEFIFSLQSPNEVTIKFLNLIKQTASKPNRLIGIFIPPNSSHIKRIEPIINALNLVVAQNGSSYFLNFENQFYKHNINSEYFGNSILDLNNFDNLLQTLLASPLEVRSINYKTTLSEPRVRKNQAFTMQISSHNLFTTTLPIKRIFDPNSLSPYGIYWYNPQNKNHIFIGSESLLSFAGISESFLIFPLEDEYKKILIQDLAQTLVELNKVAKQNVKNFNGIDIAKIPNAPQNLKIAKDDFVKRPVKVAWMEVEIFKDAQKSKEQDILIDYIYKAGLDYLWISIAPNYYYSPIGSKAKNKNDLINMIKNFTLKLKAQKGSNKIPKILAGFEIANNLYNENKPKEFAIDIFGRNYEDVPAPLNDQFWDNEIISSFKKFAKDWRKYSNKVALSGLVIDLEMYGRKTVGMFLSTMGFEPSTFKKFNTTTTEAPLPYLVQNREVKNYFTFLNNQAIMLGQKIKKSANKAVPHCIIGCYSPNISINWFYKGFFCGLSSPKQNLMLLTFNSRFDLHKTWMLQNNIYAFHLRALMLSKIKSPADFKLTNGNIWINRFSRFIDKQDPKEWYGNEQSPLPQKDIPNFLEYLREN
ncbi:TPA: hypothetical protein DEO28_01095 [Candidatus Dependentiae bacterium]|nr:MAG: hypothetical protein UR14_C0003G0069 [candidate division TM6 bacterium GW2011_GWE2_31_21]KKP53767.1 MAG: hypothetical protein UR43_C0003G0088 [candidate division TM6 bacterium GW2011_GWF2_33_332]HBS48479.1 hypothetical protein [Candidatus Dependentiae bacterium]HBZ73094.1 hypothetical protein [Candidatus Dependentiae bacterium]